LQEKYSIVMEKNQKYIDEAMELREKKSEMMESASRAKEDSLRHQENVSNLQRQLDNLQNDTSSKKDLEILNNEILTLKNNINLIEIDLNDTRSREEIGKTSLIEMSTRMEAAVSRANEAAAAVVGLTAQLATTKEEVSKVEGSARDRAESSASHTAQLDELRAQLAVQTAASNAALDKAVTEEKVKWETKITELEEKCRRLIEVGGGSEKEKSGEGDDPAATAKKVKTAVNGMAGDVYSSAKTVFTSGEKYDGKFVLKQIKGLLKQATKNNSK
jgi:chromosome segregation ATPase